MGSIGNDNGVRSTISEWREPETKENQYGFEVEASNSPDVEFTDATWKHMNELRAYDAFRDSELADRVDNRISQLVDQYGDLEAYDSDLTTLRERIEGSNVTDDEYWAGYHVMADMLGIKPNRYTVMDSDMAIWDQRYSSLEQAELWASEQDDAKYIYDTWTRRYRTIGGKNWRK